MLNQIKVEMINVKVAGEAMVDGMKNNKEFEEVLESSETVKKGMKTINFVGAIIATVIIGAIVAYLSGSLRFGYSDKDYQKVYPAVALAASATSNDKEFESMSTWKLFRNPSVSDVKLTQYWKEGNDFWIESTNKTDQYVYVKITAKASGLNGNIEGVAYGVIAPKSTVKVFGQFKQFALDIDPKGIKVEKVAIFDMDKAIDNMKKSTKKK